MTVLATAGHVDHGKSSLVRALTGTDPDRWDEEKRRGLTIDLGFAHATLPSGRAVSIVDVPGHERFVHNMLAGVGGIAGCLFVVDAREGFKPQSEEHLRILELLGVAHGVVVLTKIDLVDDDTRQIAALDVADHVAGSFLDGAPVVHVSAHTGAGLDELIVAIEELVARAGDAIDRGRARLWVDRVFAARGSGTVVTGTLIDGSFAVDDAVVLEPGGQAARVRGIQTAGLAVESIAPGHRVALNLASIDHHELRRGVAVVAPERWHRSDRIDVSLHVLDTLGHDVSRRGAYVAHIGAGEHPVRVRVLGADTIAPGAVAAARIFLPEPLPLLPGDRYVLRESGRAETVGGGEILDVAPVLPASRARPDRSIGRVVAERGWVLAATLERLVGTTVTPTVGQWCTTPALLTALADEVRERVAAAGPAGLDLAALDDRGRAVVATLEDLSVDAGVVRPATATDAFADHPFLAVLAAGGFNPPSPQGVARGELRELVRRGLVVERDGIYVHASVVDAAAELAARLLASRPQGYTVSDFRAAAGTTRKFAVPLVAELDARGVTRRRGDLRIAGPRLPNVAAQD